MSVLPRLSVVMEVSWDGRDLWRRSNRRCRQPFQRAGYPSLVWVWRAEMIPQVNNELSRLGRWLDDNVGHAEMPGDPVEVTDSLDRVGWECGYMVEAIAEDTDRR